MEGLLFGLLAIALVVFVIYLVLKQIDFILRAIPLYEEMVSNQKIIINLLQKLLSK